MKRLTVSAIILLIGTPAFLIAATPDRNQVIDREQAAWQAYKDKKADVFRKMVSDNYRGIYPDAIYTVDGEMRSLRETDLKSFSLSRFDIVSTDDDTMIVTYEAQVQASRGSKDTSSTYNAASVWQKHGSDWQVVLHTNVPAEKASTPATTP